MRVAAMLLSLLGLVASAQWVGKPAPPFALNSDRGEVVQLSDFKGKQYVVLAFFPKAFTPG